MYSRAAMLHAVLRLVALITTEPAIVRFQQKRHENEIDRTIFILSVTLNLITVNDWKCTLANLKIR